MAFKRPNLQTKFPLRMAAVLISALQQGSETAFRELFQSLHEKLYFFFLQKTRSVAASEELVQLTFIKIWRFRQTLDTELPVSQQLFRIGRTCMIDWLRSEAANRTVPLETIPSPIIPETPAVLHEEDPLEVLQETLAALPPMRRKIITCRLQGLTNKEIADQLAISRKTVENQVNRAVRDIRRFHAQATFLALVFSFVGR